MSDSENISQSAFATVCRERDDAVALLAQYSAEREHNALQALAYKAERDDLDRWKAEQMAVESTWNEQAIGRLLNLPLGSPIRAQIQPAIESMREAIKEAHRAIVMSRKFSCILATPETTEGKILESALATLKPFLP